MPDWEQKLLHSQAACRDGSALRIPAAAALASSKAAADFFWCFYITIRCLPQLSIWRECFCLWLVAGLQNTDLLSVEVQPNVMCASMNMKCADLFEFVLLLLICCPRCCRSSGGTIVFQQLCRDASVFRNHIP